MRNKAGCPATGPVLSLSVFLGTVIIPSLFAQGTNSGAPVWTPVMQPGETVEYYKYYNNGTTDLETAQRSTSTPRPPYTYQFPGSSPGMDRYLSPASYTNGFARSVCRIYNQSKVHWYRSSTAASGTPLAGTFPMVYGAEEFNVSHYYSGVKGLTVLASFNGAGSPESGSALEVAYFTSRGCSDGGTEYGFVGDLTGGAFYFYWSTYANCGILDSKQTDPTLSLCRIVDNPCVSSDFANCQVSDNSNVQQENADDYHHGITISNLQESYLHDYLYYYSAYVVESLGAYYWRLQVVDPTTFCLATCSFNGGASGKCTFDAPVGPWFPLSSVYDGMPGYVVIGTSAGGPPPNVAGNPTFQVNSINIGQ